MTGFSREIAAIDAAVQDALADVIPCRRLFAEKNTGERAAVVSRFRPPRLIERLPLNVRMTFGAQCRRHASDNP